MHEQLPMPATIETASPNTINRRSFLRAAGLIGAAAAAPNLLGACSDEADNAPNPTDSYNHGSGEFSKKPDTEWAFTTADDLKGLTIGTPEKEVYNNEAQVYVANTKNVRVANKNLVLQARKEHRAGKDYTSGYVDSNGAFSFEYGRIEARMKLPKGKGVWPAFWLLSANQPHTADLHPRSEDWEQPRFYMHDGELDIAEFYGHTPGRIEATLHTFDASSEDHIQVPDASEKYHTYGIDIAPERIVWTVDGKAYKTMHKPDKATADIWPVGNGNEFYWILNLAMGGDGGGAIDNSHKNDWNLLIDHVRFYEYQG